MKKESMSFELIPIPEMKQLPKSNSSQLNVKQTSRLSIELNEDLFNKIKDYGYWEGLTQQEICCQALEIFFEKKEIKSRPDSVKNRPKVGRKKKNHSSL